MLLGGPPSGPCVVFFFELLSGPASLAEGRQVGAEDFADQVDELLPTNQLHSSILSDLHERPQQIALLGWYSEFDLA